MVEDMMTGGDLRTQLDKYSFSENTIKIWIAEIACAVDYLHENGIVHRDVKPDNILLDRSGHARLGDFNVATQLTCDRPVIHGVSGTFNYLAPEMHEGSPYTEQVDWWALGVVFYECIYGKVPFKAKTWEGMLAIMLDPGLIQPKTDPEVSEQCQSAIERFLKIYPYDRIRDTQTLFRLRFFKNLNRKMLENFNYCDPRTGKLLSDGPIFVPSEDHINFDQIFDTQDVLEAEINFVCRAGRKKANKNNNQKDRQNKKNASSNKGVHPRGNQEKGAQILSLNRYKISINGGYNIRSRRSSVRKSSVVAVKPESQNKSRGQSCPNTGATSKSGAGKGSKLGYGLELSIPWLRSNLEQLRIEDGDEIAKKGAIMAGPASKRSSDAVHQSSAHRTLQESFEAFDHHINRTSSSLSDGQGSSVSSSTLHEKTELIVKSVVLGENPEAAVTPNSTSESDNTYCDNDIFEIRKKQKDRKSRFWSISKGELPPGVIGIGRDTRQAIA